MVKARFKSYTEMAETLKVVEDIKNMNLTAEDSKNVATLAIFMDKAYKVWNSFGPEVCKEPTFGKFAAKLFLLTYKNSK